MSVINTKNVMENQLDIADIKSSVSISSIIGKDIPLQQHGSELIGMCCFHSDTKPSLTVSDNKGFYKCFSCGAHGDVFDYLKHQRGMSLNQAKEYLGIAKESLPSSKPKPKSSDEWDVISPVPEDHNKPNFNHKDHGEPSLVHVWKGLNGELLGYTARYNLVGGAKVVLPISYCQKIGSTVNKWVFKRMPKPHPLYGLHLLKKHKKVLIVEGEKCADVANNIFGSTHAVITWIGGVEGIKHSDWQHLQSKDVIIWPDFDLQVYKDNHQRAGQIMDYDDQPGQRAALEIQKILPHAKILDIPRDKPKGWDVADALSDDGWEDYQFYAFIDQFKPVSAVIPDATNQLQVREDIIGDIEPFRFLGYDDSKYYFFLNTELQVISRANTALDDYMNITQLAPKEWWEDEFLDGKHLKGESLARIATHLMYESRQFGIFNPENIRGRGCWIDGKKVVIHAGNKLIVDGRETETARFKSDYIYPGSQAIRINVNNPLSASDANKFMQLCERLLWERPIYATLLAGWCVVAPMCGALDWRPHIWVTSKAGGGKSWTMDNIIRPMMGDFGLFVQGRTTEAGVRQCLKSDAMPVLFDEAESENQRAGSTIESVLALMRQASSETGGKIIKGTAGGKSQSFTVRSCFALSSIAVNLQHNSDISRVCVLSLLPDNSEEAQELFERLKNDAHETLTQAYCENMQARTIKYLHILKRNAITFSEAAAKHLGSKRLGDQIGILIAGAYLLYSSKLVSQEIADDWISKRDWSEQQVITDDTDENKLMQMILSTIIRVNTGKLSVNRNIGELIQICQGEDLPFDHENPDHDKITKKQASDELLRIGLKVHPTYVIVSNSHEGIKSLLRNTHWCNNWSRTLKRIDGSVALEQVKFKSIKTRAVSVPYESK